MRQLSRLCRCVLLSILFILPEFSFAKNYQLTEIAKNLDFPWSLAFLPNRDMLVSERSGNLRIIKNGKLLESPITGLPQIYVQGQGGLFDILVDPEFNQNQRLFISFASGSSSENALRVISAQLDGLHLNNVKTLLTVTPEKNTPHHFGGRMAMLTDGTILITSGEGFNFREQAQSLKSMLGKILRINTDGSIPEDNPFVGHENILSEIFSYGHRNPQGIVLSHSGKV